MSRLRSLLALGATAAVAVSIVAIPAQGASNTNLHVYVSNCVKQVYKPKSITIACADAGIVVQSIKYSSYGAKAAAGTGTAAVNDCTPSCVAGKTHKYPVKIALSRVTQCGDSYQFRRVTVRFKKAVPKGFKRTDVTSFPCANAPT